MNSQAIRKRVAWVRELAERGQHADAHAEEDALHRDVLEEIAAGHCDGKACAKAALETAEIAFQRLYGG
jgi:hypothetical protein